MKNTFDLKKFLVENKLTSNSRLLKEYVEVKSAEELAKSLEKELGVNGRITYKVEGEPLSGLPKKFAWAMNHMLKNDNNPELDTFCKHAFDWLNGNNYTVNAKGGSFGSDATISASHESGNGSEQVVVSIYRAKMSEGSYTSEEEDKAHQIMATVKEKIGFDYPVFEEILQDAIALMDEQEGTEAIDALYSVAETWNEEYMDNGDENGEDITSRMMSVLDSMQA